MTHQEGFLERIQAENETDPYSPDNEEERERESAREASEEKARQEAQRTQRQERKRDKYAAWKLEREAKGPPLDPKERATFYARSGQLYGSASGDCGTPLDNPNAQWTSSERDGSCDICEHPPEPIVRCPAAKPAMAVGHETRRLKLGVTISLAGSLGHLGRRCHVRGGPCACNNACGALLELFPRGSLPEAETKQEEGAFRALSANEAKKRNRSYRERMDALPRVTIALAELPESGWPYTDRAGALYCGGDEGSTCCPYRLVHNNRWTDVIITGQLVKKPIFPEEPTSPESIYLLLNSICSLE